MAHENGRVQIKPVKKDRYFATSETRLGGRVGVSFVSATASHIMES